MAEQEFQKSNASVDPETPAKTSKMGNLGLKFSGIVRKGEIFFVLAIMGILVFLIIPMPSFFLDIFLALSLLLSCGVLVNVLFIQKVLEFNSFPIILLIATLMRLSLNLASTRLILSEGHMGSNAAGAMINAFGTFIIGSNFVIGIIVFLILILVNFLVITKGATRIAEVTARFTLDAMPGKQMAIDADLSAGLIDEGQARQRREEVQKESDFFGAMDGASKFVRGDAVAGLVITVINIIGGILIGVLQKGMKFSQALDVYSRLTVGDGLVSQIPALIISVAAGLMVTKSGMTGSTESAVIGQFTNNPRVLIMVTFLALILSLLPGIPFIPFFILCIVLGYGAYSNYAKMHKSEVLETQALEQEKSQKNQEEPLSSVLKVDIVRLELGYGLLSMINGGEGNQPLTDQIKALRRALAAEMGFVIPPIRIQDNMQLQSTDYVVSIKEVECGRGLLRPGRILLMSASGEKVSIPGEHTTEPTFGLPAVWADPSHREDALFKGYTVVDASTVLTTHLTEIIRDNMSDMLSYSEIRKLFNELGEFERKLMDEIIPSQVSFMGVQRVLQNLLSERISIRDLSTILEAISEASAITRNVVSITEHVRGRLSRQISDIYKDHLGNVNIVVLSTEWEQAFMDALVGERDDRHLAMPPTQLQEFVMQLRQRFEALSAQGENPVLVTSPLVRPFVRSVIDRFRPMTAVISQNEISAKVKIRTLGQL